MDYEEFDDSSEDEQDEQSLPAKLRAQLKEANKLLKAERERAEANAGAARRVAFEDAGIPRTKQTSFFMDKYDGELSEEAIKQAAIDNGFLETMTPEVESQVAALETQSDVFQGASTPLAPESSEAMYEEMRKAKDADEINRIAQRYGQLTADDFR
jgi:hypothetical protein